MMRRVSLLSFFFMLIFGAQATLAQQQVLTINVIDLKEQTRSGVTIKCKEGCPATTSDQNGTAVLTLMPENLNAGIVELQVVKRSTGMDWVLISPWDGKWPIVKRSLTVVVARHGDRLILASGKALEAMTARVLKEVTPKLDQQISDEERKLVLKQQAEAVGLKPEEVDQAIREWGKTATDLYQQGLTALYEKNFPKAEQLLTQTYQAQKSAFQDAAFFLGQTLYEEGNYSRAVEKFQEVYLLKKDDPAILNWLGNSLYQAGRFSEAEPLFKQALDINRRVLGEDHPNTAASLDSLAVIYQSQGRDSEAEPLFKRALDINQKSFGENHSNTATSLSNLAALYREQGKYSEAEPLFKRALAINEKAASNGGRDENRDLAISLNNLAELYKAQKRYSEAELLLKRALAIVEKALGERHPDIIPVLINLAGLLRDQGKYGEAELLYKRALDISEKVLGMEHHDTAICLGNLAGLYLDQKRYSEAAPLFKRALGIFEKTFGKEDLLVAEVLESYAFVLRKINREKEAAELEARAKEIREKAKLKGKN